MAYVVTGRKDAGVYPRLELRDLKAQHPEQWTLFILSLHFVQQPGFLPMAVKDVPETASLLTSELSTSVQNAATFVQLGGIHGLPYERWPGDPASGVIKAGTAAKSLLDQQRAPVQSSGIKTEEAAKKAAATDAEDDVPELRFGGYCNHASILFPVWHRPYMMAVEQSIGEIATAIAQQIVKVASIDQSTKSKWIQAARELRFPFWDWTLKDTLNGLPSLIADPKVTIALPNSTVEIPIDNPLSTYNFGNSLPDGFQDILTPLPESGDPEKIVTAYFSEWKRTCRWPKSTPAANDDYATLNKKLRLHYGSLRSKVAHLFAFDWDPQTKDSPRMWDEFSNTTFQSSGKMDYNSKSLESPHNSVHVYVGGIGHMGQNDYAGFDPVFYLHHANVDRIFALWEYVYPFYWMGSGYNDDQGKFHYFAQPGGGTYTLLDSSRVDQASDMLPFRKTLDSYWTASDCRSFLPDAVPKWYTYPPVAGVQVDKPATLDQLNGYRLSLQRYFGLRPEPIKTRIRSPLFSRGPKAVPDGQQQIRNYKHIVISVALLEHALDVSYTLEVKWQSGPDVEPEYGHVAVLTRAQDSNCAGCAGRRAASNVVRGFIHLGAPGIADILRSRPDATDSEGDEIQYLKDQLTAELVTASGHVYATTDVGVQGQGPLNVGITPELRLYSAFAGRSLVDADENPVSFFDWTDHGELFVDQWKKL